jgi:hypothetical protein
LIESLEQRLATSVVWECLQARGVSQDTLLKKWKRRALIYLGKAYVGLLEFKLARNCFKSALGLIQSDPTLVKECNEIQQLIVTTSKKLDKQTKNEKTIWSKAFKKQESEPEELVASGQPLSPPSPTKGSKVSSKKGLKEAAAAAAEEEEEIDLSEFGIGKKSSGPGLGGEKKNSKNQVALKNTTQSFLFFSIFSLGLLGVFTYFGKLRNFKWRF